jgi:hypothetical protein
VPQTWTNSRPRQRHTHTDVKELFAAAQRQKVKTGEPENRLVLLALRNDADCRSGQLRVRKTRLSLPAIRANAPGWTGWSPVDRGAEGRAPSRRRRCTGMPPGV